MQLYQAPNFPKLNKPIVSIGFFDGVHKGHKQLLNQLTSLADENKTDHLLISLWPHPSLVIGNSAKKRFLLNSLEEKAEQLEKNGIKHFLVLEFNEDLMRVSAADFIKLYLKEKLDASAILLGFNNSFGYGGASFQEIQKCSIKQNIKLVRAEEFKFESVDISSSAIRNFVENGELEIAADLLGYNYTLDGIVVSGFKIGRSLGFKTANIKPCFDEKILPGMGVYAVSIKHKLKQYKGMMSVGTRPTFDGKDLSLETHIFNFEEEIYGDIISIEFFKKIRNEKKFPDVESLKQQIENDKKICLQYFKNLSLGKKN
ncbi:MAG: bifunctional riboflavin kinase/FAD synthetase [Bacteroidales bacterium]|nr:bifunctional riboflavin kinase/FAD synthetase [Bacteroidales bacterium]